VTDLTPDWIRHRRLRNDWSLQDLANRSGVNKAYLSEFESGKRKLPDEIVEQLATVLESQVRAGTARARLVEERGRHRLVFVDEHEKEIIRPKVAHIRWTEADGTTYSMFVGDLNA
jgi:transcriptional regulator with XRE-family HTH domain